jgi:hypothetical protein
MRAPIESRLLLAAASRLVPPPFRADWLREWEAEVWWWRNGHPDARTFAARMRLLAHCRGAFADARCVRGQSQAESSRRFAWHSAPGACLVALSLLIALVVSASGGLRRTREAFRGVPSQDGRRLAILSQTGPFMGWHSGVPAAAVRLWSARSRTVDGIAILGASQPGGLASAVCRLKPGVTPQAAQAELRDLIARAGRGTSGAWVTVTPLDEVVAGPIKTLIPAWLGVLAALALLPLAGRRRGFRYRAFFAAKAALSLTVLLFGGIEFGRHLFGAGPGDALLGEGAVSLWLSLALPVVALWWCWADQRTRCRVCLSRLSMPAPMGYGARTLFETGGTELLCPGGHGRLLVSEGASPHSEWAPLDATWRDLFPEGPAA